MTDYFQLSGAGNDFLALVEPERTPGADEIRAWCRRGLSLGADGLFVLRRDREAAAGADRPCRVVMDHYNPDGHPAALCVNGTRCAARLGFHLGWADERLEIVTGAGTVEAEAQGRAAVALRLPELVTEPWREVTVELDGRLWEGYLLLVGVPHLVLPYPDELATAPVTDVGARLRAHPAVGDAGANVDFVAFRSREELEIRTFERGVEAETLACGSGVIAAAAVGRYTRRCELPVRAVTRGGWVLEVDRHRDGWALAGDARLLAKGTVLPAASEPPPNDRP